MPSLGFLKKIRSKDSQGSPSDFKPGSPTTAKDKDKIGSPISPVLSKTSNFFSEPEADPNAPSAPSTSVAPGTTPASSNKDMSGAGNQIVGQSATSNTQQVPSIRNMVNGPDYGNNGQHDSAYASTNNGSIPQINTPAAAKTTREVRETKGKYTLPDFTISRTLGTGSFGRVHLVQSKHNQRFYAVKVLKKAQVVRMKQVEHTNDERRMLQRCRHPFLITLWGTWQDSKNLYMVMDFIEGGELFSLLRKSQVSPMAASEAPIY